MAKRISDLPAATSVATTDEFELNQGGTSRKATRAQLVDGLASATHAHALADITDAGALAAKDSVGAAQIDPEAIGTASIQDGAVTPAKLDRAYAEAGHGHAEATTGAAGFMSTSDKTKLDGIEAGAEVNRPLASQAEAEAGTDNAKGMTPLRTAQAIAAQAAAAGHQHTLADVTDAGALAALETVGSAQIDDDAVTLAKLTQGTANRLLGFDAAGAPAEISAGTGIAISGGTISATNGGGAGAPTGAAYLVLSNDVDLTEERALVVTGGLDAIDGGANGSYTLSIADGGVGNTKLADMADRRLKGRASAGSGVPEDLTAAQAWSILNAPATLTFGPTVSWDVGAAPIAKVTLTGNCTINASNVPEGQIAVLVLHQDATGGRSVAWGTGFSGVDPVHALGGNGVSALYFGGTSSGLVMTQVLRASQAEAEAGATHARLMTPLRTAQAIAAQAAPASHGHVLADITDAGALAAKDTVGTSDLDDDAVTTGKLAHGPADRLLGFGSSGAPAPVSAGAGLQLAGGVLSAEVASVFGRTGAVVAQAGDYDGLPLDLQDAQLRRPELRDYSETAPAPTINSGTLTLDLESGNAFDVVLTQNIGAIDIVNAPATGKLGTITVRFRQDATGGRTVDLSGFEWGSAAAPAVPTTPTTGRLWLMALTLDGGASWDALSGFEAN